MVRRIVNDRTYQVEPFPCGFSVYLQSDLTLLMLDYTDSQGLLVPPGRPEWMVRDALEAARQVGVKSPLLG